MNRPSRLGLALFAFVALRGGRAQAQVIGESTSEFRAGPMEVTLRFGDDRARGFEGQIRPLLSGALERYTQIFGSPPRGSDGQPMTTLVVRVRSDALGGGDSDQGLIQIGIARQPLFGFYDWRLTLLHEAFHLWSGESFAGAGPAEQWFNEGAAEFYAMQTAALLGVVDDVTAIRNMATLVGFYTSALDQPRMSFAEAGQRKDEHYFLVTDGGATAMLLLDYSIRAGTADARSMDDVMRWMFGSFDSASRRYTTMDVARGVRAATQQDMTEFFARHLFGRLPLPVATTINLGELARGLQTRRAAGGGTATPDSLLLHSLGLERRR